MDLKSFNVNIFLNNKKLYNQFQQFYLLEMDKRNILLTVKLHTKRGDPCFLRKLILKNRVRPIKSIIILNLWPVPDVPYQ